MATNNKDFKVKHGLIVEGTNGTINNHDILTKSQESQDYIVDLIGGSATPINTPDTVVLRDENGDFAAGEITADLVGDVTGQVSDISNHDTDDLSEGTTNKYYTDGRVKDVLTGSTQTNISITNVGGVLHIEAENGVADSTTDDLDEGTTNKYYTDSRARAAISEGTGINYDNTTGVVSADLGDFDTDDLTEGASNKYFTEGRARSAINAGVGVNFNSSTGYIDANLGTGLDTDGSNNIKIDRTTVDTWYDANGAAGDVASDLSTHEGLTSAHGVTGDIVGTTDTQSLTNKTILDGLYFGTDNTNASRIEGENDGAGSLTVQAGEDLNLTATAGSIILSADSAAYYGSASAENEIATHGYVDNAVSGLTWKQSVNLLWNDSNATLTGATGTLVVDGHSALDSNDSGYRILITTGANRGIWDYSDNGSTWTLTRSADADSISELIGAAVYVMEGTQFGATSWVQGNHYAAAFTDQTWTQFSGSGSVTAGSGITVDGLEVSVDRSTVDTWYDYNGAASDAIDAHDVSTGVHGLSGYIVGTSDSQTLTNKSIDGSDNTLTNIPNSSLDNSSITVNGYSTDLGSSVTLDTDDVSEGTAQYFTQTRARQSLSGGTAINYDDTTGVIAVDATELDTDDISEGTTNKYYTDSRVKSVLTGSTQSNISITEVAGELIITAENGVDDSTTDDLEEGTNNHYFTDSRAKQSAASLLTGATKTNIVITGDENGLTITAEDGIAGKTTDDLEEGDVNLYFTDARAQGAINDTTPNFAAVEINLIATQVAALVEVPTASQVTAFSFAKADYRSAKFLVKTAYGSHTELTEVLMTLDASDNIAMTEYAIVGTNGSSMNVTADIDGSNVRLRVTTLNNTSVVTVVGTLLA